MSTRQFEGPARGAKSNPRPIKTENKSRSSFVPLVGEPWPELKAEDLIWPDADNYIGMQYRSKEDRVSRTQSFTIGLKLKTRVFVICLLVIVTSYAACNRDSALIREVIKAITLQHSFESPP